MVYHHPAKFGHHRHCGGGDVMTLVYPVIFQDHLAKWSYGFMGRRPPKVNHQLPKFGAHRQCVSEDNCINSFSLSHDLRRPHD